MPNSASDAAERQRGQDNRSMTPRVAGAAITNTNIAASPFSSARASVSGLNNKGLFSTMLTLVSEVDSDPPDIFNSFFGNAQFSSSPLSSSLTNEIEVPSNHAAQQSLDDSDVDQQSR